MRYGKNSAEGGVFLEKVPALLKERQSLLPEMFLSEYDAWNSSSHSAETWGKTNTEKDRMKRWKVSESLITPSSVWIHLGYLNFLPQKKKMSPLLNLVSLTVFSLPSRYPVSRTKGKTSPSWFSAICRIQRRTKCLAVTGCQSLSTTSTVTTLHWFPVS